MLRHAGTRPNRSSIRCMLRNDRESGESAHQLGLREFEIFLAFAQTEHMGQAAEALGTSAPSIQRTVRALEVGLGIPLVERDGRRLRLLPAGQVLAEHAARIMRSRTDAIEATLAASGQKRVALRLGHIFSLGLSVVPRYIAKMLRKEPGIRVHLHQGTTNGLITSLLAGEIDAAFVSPPPDDPELRVVPLFTEPLLLALLSDDPLANGEAVDLGAFRDRGFVTLFEGSMNRICITRLCARAGFLPKIVLEVSDLCTLEGAVALGIGVSIVPRSASGHVHPNVAHVPITGMVSTTRTVVLAYRRNAPHNGALVSLLSVAEPHYRK